MDDRRANLEELYDQQYPTLVRTAAWIVGDVGMAEELVQESFIRFAQSRHRIKTDDATVAYLRRIVVNQCRSRVRRIIVGRKKLDTIGRSSENRQPISAESNTSLLDGDFGQAIQRLPRRQRECVVLRFEQDLTIDQIADALRLAPGTVKSNLHRGLKKLRTQIENGEPS